MPRPVAVCVVAVAVGCGSDPGGEAGDTDAGLAIPDAGCPGEEIIVSPTCRLDTLVLAPTEIFYFYGDGGEDPNCTDLPRGLRRVAKTGGESIDWVPVPHDLAVDATHVYGFSRDGSTWSLDRWLLDGSGHEVLAPDLYLPGHLILDGDRILFAAMGSEELETIYEMSSSGGPVDVLAETTPSIHAVAVSPTRAFWSSPSSVRWSARDGSGDGMALVTASQVERAIGIAGDDVYYTVGAPEGVWRVPQADGTPSKIADELAGAFAVDDEYLYWSSARGRAGGVHRVPIAGGEPEMVGCTEGAVLSDFAVDQTHVYWIESDPADLDSRDLRRVPK